MKLPLDSLVSGQYDGRDANDASGIAKVADIKASIERHGFIPGGIKVALINGDAVIQDGHHTVEAARQAGLTEIEVVIVEPFSEIEKVALNQARRNDDALTIARAIDAAITNGANEDDVKRIMPSQDIEGLLALARVIPEVQEYFGAHNHSNGRGMTLEFVKLIHGLGKPAIQRAFWKAWTRHLDDAQTKRIHTTSRFGCDCAIPAFVKHIERQRGIRGDQLDMFGGLDDATTVLSEIRFDSALYDKAKRAVMREQIQGMAANFTADELREMLALETKPDVKALREVLDSRALDALAEDLRRAAVAKRKAEYVYKH